MHVMLQAADGHPIKTWAAIIISECNGFLRARTAVAYEPAGLRGILGHYYSLKCISARRLHQHCQGDTAVCHCFRDG